jgi:hypothetical protein
MTQRYKNMKTYVLTWYNTPDFPLKTNITGLNFIPDSVVLRNIIFRDNGNNTSLYTVKSSLLTNETEMASFRESVVIQSYGIEYYLNKPIQGNYDFWISSLAGVPLNLQTNQGQLTITISFVQY